MSEVKVVRTACSPHCANVCGISAYVKDGRLIKIEPANYADSRYSRICLKGLSEIQRVYHPDRLRYPLKRLGKRGEGKWQRISWDEAISTITAKLTDIQWK